MKICSASLIVSDSEIAQSCLTLCDPMDCSLSGSSIHGIFQARVLEWIAISFSRGSLQADALPSEPPRQVQTRDINLIVTKIWLLFKVMLLDLQTVQILREKVSKKPSGVLTFRGQVAKEKLAQQNGLGQIIQSNREKARAV